MLYPSCLTVVLYVCFRRQHPEHTLFRDIRDKDRTDESVRFSTLVLFAVSPCSNTGEPHSYYLLVLMSYSNIQTSSHDFLSFVVLPHQPDVHPGNCWAFKGSTGYLVIRLCVKIVPTAFSLEHIPKALSPTGNISSAPRNFTVYVRPQYRNMTANRFVDLKISLR